MNTVPAVIHIWLYLANASVLGESVSALTSLADALSIPSQHIFAGDDIQADDSRHYMQTSKIIYYPLQGDFAYSCDCQLSGWTLPHVEASLIKLSILGLTVAMIDETDASPFACILFEQGSRLKVTVVVDDETNEATMYPVQDASL